MFHFFQPGRNEGPSLGGWCFRALVLLVLLLLPITSLAVQPLEVITGSNIKGYLRGIHVPNEGESNVYRPPTQQELTIWRNVVRTILSGNYLEAAELAAQVDYRMVYYRDTSEPQGNHLILREESSNPGWHGVYVFRIDPVRNLIMESPHPIFDGTWTQAIDLYIETESLAFIQAGTHRRNSPVETPCDGTLQGAPNRISDMAHVVDSFFQIAHEELHNHYRTAVCVSVHGMADSSHASDVIVSNGTTGSRTFADSLSRQLASRMNELLHNDPQGRYAVSHQEPFNNYPLSGSTNKQGRFSNGSPNPCLVSVSSVSGPERFIHLEQGATVRNDPPSRWSFVTTAFNELIPNLPPRTVAPGPPLILLAWWPFDGNGTDVIDGRNGTLFGNPTPAQGRPQRVDGALSFNGSNQYVPLPLFDYIGPHEEFTLSFWFESEPNGNTFQYLVSQGPIGYSFISEVDRLNLPSSFHIYTANSDGGSLRVRYTAANGTHVEHNGSSGLLNGEWNHLALTYSFTNGTRVWLNGEPEAHFPGMAGGGFNPETDLFIGARSDLAPGRFFGRPEANSGRINDIRIFNRAMVQHQIQTRIAEDLKPNDINLWQLY